nr:unnamed protein product [Callosobruchus analis]
MNNDFWNQARGPPQNMPQNLSNSNQNSPVPGSTNSIPAHSPSQQSNSSQIHVQQTNSAQQNNQQQAHAQQQPSPQAHQQQSNQQQQQQQQMNQQQQQLNQQQMNQQQQQQQQPGQNGGQGQQQQQNQQQQPPQQSPHLGSPNSAAQAAHAHALVQVAQQQQQMVNMHQQLGSGQNSPDKLMTEKIVNELQVGLLSLSYSCLPDLLVFCFGVSCGQTYIVAQFKVFNCKPVTKARLINRLILTKGVTNQNGPFQDIFCQSFLKIIDFS